MGVSRLRSLMDGSAVVDLLPVGAVVCAPSGELLYYNEHAAAMWGRRPERFDPAQRYTGVARVLRRDGTALHPDDTPIAIALRTGEELAGVETILERGDGTRVRVQSYVCPVHDDLDLRIAAIEVFHELARVRIEHLESTERLVSAVRAITRETTSLRERTRAMRAELGELSVAVDGLVELTGIARTVAARFAERALAVDASIRVDAPDRVHAVGDAARVEAVVSQMIEDALRHARGGRVDVRVHRAALSGEISVSNHGYAPQLTMSLPLPDRSATG